MPADPDEDHLLQYQCNVSLSESVADDICFVGEVLGWPLAKVARRAIANGLGELVSEAIDKAPAKFKRKITMSKRHPYNTQ